MLMVFPAKRIRMLYCVQEIRSVNRVMYLLWKPKARNVEKKAISNVGKKCTFTTNVASLLIADRRSMTGRCDEIHGMIA